MENTNIEIWKDIEGFEGLYQVSNLGRVKSLGNGLTWKTERILKTVRTKDGYLKLVLSKNNVRKYFRVHRLVAQAFIPNPDNLPEVNHKNEDKTDNRVENLEWCTLDYNIRYGTHFKRSGKARRKPVLCVETGIVYPSVSIAAISVKGLYGNISSCCNGKRNTAYGYHWQYSIDQNGIKK